MKYFSRKVMYPRKREKGLSESLDLLFAAYRRHVETIQSQLPDGARRLSTLSFHDGSIESVTHVSKRELLITLRTGHFDLSTREWLPYGIYSLRFSGVQKAWVPYTVAGDIWLYEEMHLSDLAAFDYQALLYSDEIRVLAREVSIEFTGDGQK